MFSENIVLPLLKKYDFDNMINMATLAKVVSINVTLWGTAAERDIASWMQSLSLISLDYKSIKPFADSHLTAIATTPAFGFYKITAVCSDFQSMSTVLLKDSRISHVI